MPLFGVRKTRKDGKIDLVFRVTDGFRICHGKDQYIGFKQQQERKFIFGQRTSYDAAAHEIVIGTRKRTQYAGTEHD